MASRWELADEAGRKRGGKRTAMVFAIRPGMSDLCLNARDRVLKWRRVVHTEHGAFNIFGLAVAAIVEETVQKTRYQSESA